LYQPLENYSIVIILFLHNRFTIYRCPYRFTKQNKALPLSFTAFSAPRVAPTNITAFNTSSTSLHVTWQPISTQGLRGIFRAYRVYYIEQETYFTRSLKNVTVDSATLEVELVDLYKFTNYTVYVVARTNKDGVSSEKVNAFTDEDSKYATF